MAVKIINKCKPLLSSKEIAQVVKTSQCIEGYKSAPIETKKRVQALMEKHSVEVSF